MPLDSTELRISLQRVLAALIVILVPVTVFGVYFSIQADRHARQMNGAYVRTVTAAAAASTSDWITEQVTALNVIANEPSLVQSVAAANRTYQNLSDTQIQAKIGDIEKGWGSPATDLRAQAILTSDLARLLRRHRELNPRLLKIVVADEAGATIAATDKPSHFSQPIGEYWRSISSRNQGTVYVTDVRYDEQTRSHYVGIGFPVLQEGSGRFIGAVTALVDIRPLFASLNQQQIASTGHVFLIRDDGTVLSAPGITPSMTIRSQEYVAIKDALGTVQGRQAGYIDATLSDGKTYLIGFADTGLKAAYPNLGWIVVASQTQQEASGPVRNMAYFAMLMLALGLLMLAVLGAYVLLHRKQQLEDLAEPEGMQPRNAA